MDLRPRILIVSDNISMRMGGEASFPFVYAKLLMARGAEVWMVGHARVRDELRTSFPEAWDRIRFVEDMPLMVLIFRLGRLVPYRVRDLIFDQLIHMLTQRRARGVALELIREQGIEVVFEPSPIAPKAVSYMYGLGVPVAIGPLCGGSSIRRPRRPSSTGSPMRCPASPSPKSSTPGWDKAGRNVSNKNTSSGAPRPTGSSRS